MTRSCRFRLLFAAGVLLPVLAAGCEPAPSGAVVVTATVLEGDEPVPGATVSVELPHDSSATAATDSTGRARVELGGVRGAGRLEVARDTSQPRPDRAYAPVLLAPGDSADVVIALDADPGHQARYTSDTRAARWGRAAQALTAIEHDHYAAYREWVDAGQPGELEVDYGGTVDSVRSWLGTEHVPEVRSALWLALLTVGARGGSVAPAEADQALEELAPDAEIWAWRPTDMPPLLRLAAVKAEQAGAGADTAGGQETAGRAELAIRRSDAFVDRVIEAHAGSEVQARMLFAAVQFAALTNRGDEARAYYRQLASAHPESPWTGRAEQMLPNPDVQVGRPVPDVPLPALDSTAPPITPAELAGPATLVDFWAAWCTPCVAEMPVIHEAYERFHDRGFDVVSISFDASRDDVARFRERYPMPWRHSFVGAEALSSGDVAAAWGVTGLPSAFLVGPDGTIIALEDELRGERLMETLERVLGD